MSQNKQSTRTGNIREFKIFEAKQGGKYIDAAAGIVDIKYYEDILSNNILAVSDRVDNIAVAPIP